ncbi:hypothetical protein [Limnofasciculus baicalensis]|uniref:Addiction module component n=1 Tax=Limnofasciculus baicalensis BBK-W-15 TaxID=2699891 RepID=A0AAE3GVA3_9CYAN|nr:hypothetical protein [Limnofasciculus baicalensis]MCP2731360.1 hypothetical protein [Limnofasciculus baicalensis BBK-W-15]
MQSVTFNSVLEEIETLSSEDQAALIVILQRRLIESRRAKIAANIAQAKQDYQSGNVFRGTVDEAIAQLNQ